MGTDITTNANLNGAIWDLTVPGNFSSTDVTDQLNLANTWYSTLSGTAAQAFDEPYSLIVPVAGTQVPSDHGYPQVFVVDAAPEPLTTLLMGGGLIVLGLIGRKRRPS